MEGVSKLLESSTIHGFAHISTAKKYARLFWILVVVTGFLGASLLIKESFDSWSESPVETAIETLQISDIKFPKLTVCPPRNTFTDLDYDLMITENVTMTNDLLDYALEFIKEDSFSENNSSSNKSHEEDRFYNWYHVYTQIYFLYYASSGLNILIFTSARSGVRLSPPSTTESSLGQIWSKGNHILGHGFFYGEC